MLMATLLMATAAARVVTAATAAADCYVDAVVAASTGCFGHALSAVHAMHLSDPGYALAADQPL